MSTLKIDPTVMELSGEEIRTIYFEEMLPCDESTEMMSMLTSKGILMKCK